MRLRLLLASAVICISVTNARADTYANFSLNGTLANGAGISGVIQYDYSNPFGSSIAYTSLLNGTSTNYSYSASSDGYYGIYVRTVSFGYSNDVGGLDLFFNGNSTFGSLCTDQAVCSLLGTQYISKQYTANGSSVDFVSDVMPPAVTPEPSSFMLLGTGLLAMAGVVKRRFS